jgi:hypothetical protein
MLTKLKFLKIYIKKLVNFALIKACINTRFGYGKKEIKQKI